MDLFHVQQVYLFWLEDLNNDEEIVCRNSGRIDCIITYFPLSSSPSLSSPNLFSFSTSRPLCLLLPLTFFVAQTIYFHCLIFSPLPSLHSFSFPPSRSFLSQEPIQELQLPHEQKKYCSFDQHCRQFRFKMRLIEKLLCSKFGLVGLRLIKQ